MELIAVIPIIFLVAAILAWITKIDIAYLFAPAIFFISGWEYIFGLSGHLNLGMELLVLLIGVTLLVLIIKSGVFRKHLLVGIYAPSTVAFVSLSMISLYKSKDWVLSQWDEFTHWGLVVKAMYEYAALGPATPVDMVGEIYPPGISLFQYFVMDFSAGWREGLLFWATHMIVIAIIVSVLVKTSWKNPAEIALKLFVALLASSTFFNNFDNIYADPVLALSFGFLLFLAIQTSFLDGRWAIVLALTAGFVTMTKATGIYFAAAAILINVVATLFTIKFSSGKKFVLALVPALVSLITVGSVWITWRNFANRFGNSVLGPSDAGSIEFNSATNQDGVVSNFVSAFFNNIINPSYSVSMPSILWTVLCTLFFVIWAALNGKQNRKRNTWIGLTLLITTGGYFGAILLSYLTIFGPGEAAGLASYSRYIGTWYQGMFFALVMLIMFESKLFRYFDSDESKRNCPNSLSIRKQSSLFVVAFLTLNCLSGVGSYIIMLRTNPFNGVEYRTPYIPILEAVSKAKIPEQSKIYIIAQHTVGFEYYVLRYEMSDQLFGKVPWSIGTPRGEGDIWTDPKWDLKKWSNELQEYDYVVVYSTSEQFNSEYGSLFDSGVIDTNTVYKVVKTENDVSLSKVN